MDYLLRNIILFIQEIRKNILKTFLSSFGIIFLIAFLVISVSAKDTVSDYLKKRIFGELRINQIKIFPKSQPSLFSTSVSGTEISREELGRVRKIEGLDKINEVIRLNHPAYIKAGMLGMYFKTDILVSGVDKSFFRDTKYKWQDFKYKDKVPVVIPVFVMDMYNNFAASNGMPSLSPKALNLLSLEMSIGRSSFFKNNKKEYKYNAGIFGFTEAITSAGIIVPSEFIKKFCADSDNAGGRENCYSCIMIFANVRDTSKIPQIAESVRKINLNVESQADIAEKTDRAMFVFKLILSVLSGIILILTIIAVFNSYLAIVYNRSSIFSIQRMLGASKLRIIFMFIAESAIAGAVYGLAGYFAGYYSLNYLTDNISKWIPVLSGLNLKLASHAYLPAAVLFSAAVSSASAFIPAVFASNLDLFKAVKR